MRHLSLIKCFRVEYKFQTTFGTRGKVGINCNSVVDRVLLYVPVGINISTGKKSDVKIRTKLWNTTVNNIVLISLKR